MSISPIIVTVRQEACRRNNCPHVLDYEDPCAFCPEGHWPKLPECKEKSTKPKVVDDPPFVFPIHVSPGDLLSLVIGQITGIQPCAGCVEHVTEMNERGWWWCWKNRAIIVDWLTVEAEKRGYPTEKASVTHLLKLAFLELVKKKNSKA